MSSARSGSPGRTVAGVSGPRWGVSYGCRGRVGELYPAVGRTIRERYGGWRVALLVPRDLPASALGLRIERAIPLMNGAVPVSLLLT